MKLRGPQPQTSVWVTLPKRTLLTYRLNILPEVARALIARTALKGQQV